MLKVILKENQLKNEYLCYVVNEMHGLMGTCVKVHIV